MCTTALIFLRLFWNMCSLHTSAEIFPCLWGPFLLSSCLVGLKLKWKCLWPSNAQNAKQNANAKQRSAAFLVDSSGPVSPVCKACEWRTCQRPKGNARPTIPLLSPTKRLGMAPLKRSSCNLWTCHGPRCTLTICWIPVRSHCSYTSNAICVDWKRCKLVPLWSLWTSDRVRWRLEPPIATILSWGQWPIQTAEPFSQKRIRFQRFWRSFAGLCFCLDCVRPGWAIAVRRPFPSSQSECLPEPQVHSVHIRHGSVRQHWSDQTWKRRCFCELGAKPMEIQALWTEMRSHFPKQFLANEYFEKEIIYKYTRT